MTNSLFTTFGKLSPDDRFYFSFDGRDILFAKQLGSNYCEGPLKPVEYNAVDVKRREGWKFDGEERVLKV